jgi:hypothetical protein
MVIVAGHITVEPQQRKSYLADVCASSNRLAALLALTVLRSANASPRARTADGRRCGGLDGLTVATEIRGAFILWRHLVGCFALVA